MSGVPGRRPVVPGLFDRMVRVAGDRIAISGDGSPVSYRRLAALATRTAAGLAEHGVGPGDMVAVCLPRGVDQAAVGLGCWALGAVFVPLDPAAPPRRIGFQLTDCRARLLVADRPAPDRPAVPEHARLVPVVTPEELRLAGASDLPSRTVDPAAVAYAIYTSGSTGRPRGVVVSHGALGHYVRCAGARYSGSAGVSPWHAPLTFDATVTAVWVPLCCGGEVRVISGEDAVSGVDGLADLLAEPGEVGLVKATPTHLDVLDRMLGPGGVRARIRSLVVGGEELHPGQARRWIGRAAELVNEYGPTETTVGVTVFPVRPADLHRSRVPIGTPLPDLAVRVVDADGAAVPDGEVGEIAVSGPQLADGYLNLPELTAGRFVRAGGRRTYLTGDVGRYDQDGLLTFLGRRDDQVNLHGYRVELGEVEVALRAHPAVRQAGVLLVDGVLTGVVALRGPAADLAVVRRDLSAELPPYAIPDRLVEVPQLPANAHGKVDRQALYEAIGAA